MKYLLPLQRLPNFLCRFQEKQSGNNGKPVAYVLVLAITGEKVILTTAWNSNWAVDGWLATIFQEMEAESADGLKKQDGVGPKEELKSPWFKVGMFDGVALPRFVDELERMFGLYQGYGEQIRLCILTDNRRAAVWQYPLGDVGKEMVTWSLSLTKGHLIEAH